MSGMKISGVILGIIIGFQMAALAQQGAQPSVNQSARQLTPEEAWRLSASGRTLSSEEAESLENKLSSDAHDLAARFTLIGYYSSKHDESFRAKKREHILWFIQNIPDSKLLHLVVFLRLDRLDAGFDEAKQLWLKQVDTYKGNLVVLQNAIDFVLIPDKALAEKLIKQGAAAEPSEPRWRQQLGELYALQVPHASGETRRNLAALAYQQFEQALKLSKDDAGKLTLLGELARSAFEAGEAAQAETWAVDLLTQAAAGKKQWDYGNAVHQGHTILGRIALLSGNLAAARQHLIEAGETPGSPQLDSFGPNMMLAKELLEKGEREVVIQYFQLCANFWKGHSKLDEWAATVKKGGMPNFGANLVY